MEKAVKKQEKKIKEPNVKLKYKLVALNYCGVAIGNAEKSCVLAGYSEAYARGNAYKIVAKSGVQEYIKYLNSQIDSKKIASVEEIQEYWTTVFNDKKEETKDRLRASELLAKTKGAFNNDW